MRTTVPCFARLARVSFFLLSLAPITGCVDSASSVKGTVTLDEQPVKSGAVTFVKTDGELTRAGAVISNGAFQAQLPPGKYRLELNGQKVVDKRKQKGFDGKDEEVEVTQELFPERYNVKTELIQEIRPGTNKIDLKLTSAAAK